MGAQDALAVPYDAAYWQKYLEMDRQPMADNLSAARREMVQGLAGRDLSDVVDVGIGGGRFVRDAGCMGDDVNPHAIEWLQTWGRYQDHTEGARVLTFWDSLEHMRDPAAALACAREWAFVSLPIFKSGDAILESKHYRPGEHYWYWTHKGFMLFAERCGFCVVNFSDVESRIGRESIMSYALERATP